MVWECGSVVWECWSVGVRVWKCGSGGAHPRQVCNYENINALNTNYFNHKATDIIISKHLVFMYPGYEYFCKQ